MAIGSEARRTFASGLQSRQPEIEEELLLAIPAALRDPLAGADADFTSGQGEAISAALNYALNTLASARGRSVAVPSPILEQARRSARHSIGLDTVLSLYVAGREALGAIVAMDSARYGADVDRAAQAVLGSLLQQLVPALIRAHESEAERLRRSRQQRRAARIRRLLDGEPVDVTALDYEFEGWHTALIITGAGAEAAQSVVEGLGRSALFVAQEDAALWGWLRDSKPLAAAEIESFVKQTSIPQAAFAIGEPGHGLAGWRLSHRLAQEARRVAIIAPQVITTYESVGVLAPWALDRSLALAFIEVHLGPLESLGRDSAATTRETLRETFKATHQIVAAASALKVNRGTLRARLSRIERALGVPVRERQAELEIALRLEALYGRSPKP